MQLTVWLFLEGETGVRWSGPGYRDHNSPLGNEKMVGRDKNLEEVKGSRDGVSGWSLGYETSRLEPWIGSSLTKVVHAARIKGES